MIVVTVSSLPVQQIDLLGCIGDQRGGARTVSTTQAYQGEHNDDQQDQGREGDLP